MSEIEKGIFAMVLGLICFKYSQWCRFFDFREIIEKGLQPCKDKKVNGVTRIGGLIFILVGVYYLYSSLDF